MCKSVAPEISSTSLISAPDLRVRALMINVEHLTRLTATEEKPLSADKFQSIPLRRVVAGGNRNASMGVMMAHEQLNCRHWAHSDINDATSAGQKPRDDGLLDHLTGSAGIAPNNNRAGADVGAEGLGETRQQRRRQRFADHSAHTGNADLESWYSSHES